MFSVWNSVRKLELVSGEGVGREGGGGGGIKVATFLCSFTPRLRIGKVFILYVALVQG